MAVAKKSKPKRQPPKLWFKAGFTNLIRYGPSGVYFARIRGQGKLIRRSLETTVLSVAKLRLSDFEKSHRQAAERQADARQGKMPFSEAMRILRFRLDGDATLMAERSRGTTSCSRRHSSCGNMEFPWIGGETKQPRARRPGAATTWVRPSVVIPRNRGKDQGGAEFRALQDETWSKTNLQGTSNNRVFHVFNLVWLTNNVAKHSFD